MKVEPRLLSECAEGMTDAVEFEISAEMAKQFVDLTADSSSLHTDKAFGRRSMYRGNVLHGMLPILFLSAVRFCNLRDYLCSFHRISARFVRPAFVNDRLIISSRIFATNAGENQIDAEYDLRKAESSAVLTTGYFSLKYRDWGGGRKQVQQDPGIEPERCVVIDSLTQQELTFDQVRQGQKDSFEFEISPRNMVALRELLASGISSDRRHRSNGFMNCDLKNLLAASLCSTFVGMCIPGKHATILDFQLRFDRPVESQKRHVFGGEVKFKSGSVRALREHISIYAAGEEGEPCAAGKINVQVNELPIQMPSIEFLRANELDLELKDRVVLITGGSRGIGETTAKLFSLHGAKVVIDYLEGEEDAERIVGEIRRHGGDALAIQADVANRQRVKRMIQTILEKYQTIDILVNNAISNIAPVGFLELTWQDMQRDHDVIVQGAFNCCQEVLPVMLQRRRGKIINISTVAADDPPLNQAKYVAAKCGLVGLTRSLAVEFAPYNIQVNLVVPSLVETDLTKHISKMFRESLRNATPMKRHATSVDVAKAVIFLASSLSSFTTGQKIMVTGGNPPFL